MQRRTALYTATAVLAACSGAGLAWWRLQPREQARKEPEKWAALWQLPFQTREGQSLLLSQFKGQKIVLNFWATWCPPCVEEMPMLDRFYRENSAKGWQVAGIATDQATSVARFIEQKDIRFPNAVNGAQGVELSRALGNQAGGLPYTVVLGGDGQILAQKAGKLQPDDLQRWLAM
jgi:thiol-disulfide isomerase/thioredoxin